MHKLAAAAIAFLAVAASAAAQTASDLRDQLQSTLDSMTAAVLAADADAYPEHIAVDEPEFRVEQIAWANDLSRITPFVIAYDMISEPELTADGEVHVDLIILWNTPNREGQNRGIQIPARFVWDNESNAWDFGGRAWEEIDAEGLRVMYVEGNSGAARDTVAVWPDIKDHVEAGFEFELDHPQVVKLYPSMQELQFSIYASYVEPLGGWNEPGESIKLITRAGDRQGLKTVLAHEYGHALTFAMGGPDIPVAIERAHSMPWWVLEGAAELGANKYSRAYRRAQRAVSAWHENDQLADWDDITNFYETDPADYGYVYVQGLHFVAYVSDRFGRTPRNAWLRAMMEGLTLEDATAEVFGVPFSELDADWRDSITQDR
ncbi:MAG: hypothetical protein AAF937_12965 [Planctomycetota bacterium]